MTDWTPIILSLQLAAVTTLCLLIIGIPTAYLISKANRTLKTILITTVSLPLVLPPTVIGFYLLLLLSPNNYIGNLLNETFNLRLVFSFQGLVVGSIIYSFPFMIHPIYTAIESIPRPILEACQMMHKSKMTILTKVILPMCVPSIVSGAMLSFAHTIGEFGVILMIGGNIPDKTKVASIAIYDAVESLQFDTAHLYALTITIITFSILLSVHFLNKLKP